jgi:hypothetical protein
LADPPVVVRLRGVEVGLPLTGGCNCGGVRFEISEPLLGAVYCHCTRCQRRTGTAAGASAGVKPGTFCIVAGQALIRRWNAGDGNDKAFCGTCGSALFSQNPDHPERPIFDGHLWTCGKWRWLATGCCASVLAPRRAGVLKHEGVRASRHNQCRHDPAIRAASRSWRGSWGCSRPADQAPAPGLLESACGNRCKVGTVSLAALLRCWPPTPTRLVVTDLSPARGQS